MANYYLRDSAIETALQKVEGLMNELGLKIEFVVDHGGSMLVSLRRGETEQSGHIFDTDVGCGCSSLPRWMDAERIRVVVSSEKSD